MSKDIFDKTFDVLNEMMEDRGYTSNEKLDIPWCEYVYYFKSNVCYNSYVFWSNEVAVDIITKITKFVDSQVNLESTSDRRKIIIISNKLTPKSKQIAEHAPFIFTIIKPIFLTFNPTKGRNVPLYSVMSAKATEMFFKANNITNPMQIPMISSTERIVLWYGWRKGLLIKLENKQTGFITYKLIN